MGPAERCAAWEGAPGAAVAGDGELPAVSVEVQLPGAAVYQPVPAAGEQGEVLGMMLTALGFGYEMVQLTPCGRGSRAGEAATAIAGCQRQAGHAGDLSGPGLGRHGQGASTVEQHHAQLPVPGQDLHGGSGEGGSTPGAASSTLPAAVTVTSATSTCATNKGRAARPLPPPSHSLQMRVRACARCLARLEASPGSARCDRGGSLAASKALRQVTPDSGSNSPYRRTEPSNHGWIATKPASTARCSRP